MTNVTDHVGALLLGLTGWPVYVIVGLLAFLECAAFVGMVLPGETALVVAGVLAGHGSISLAAILAIGCTAAVAGDQVGFMVGRRIGPGLQSSRWARRVPPATWDRIRLDLQRRGPTTVILARFVALLRAIVPTAAGALGMPYRRFAPANAVGGVLWAGAAVLLGDLLGQQVTTATDLMSRLSWIGATMLTLAAGAEVVRRRRSRHVRAPRAVRAHDPVGLVRRDSGRSQRPPPTVRSHD
ncbi:MAG: DedA family protein [Lapillicoccus sp.]